MKINLFVILLLLGSPLCKTKSLQEKCEINTAHLTSKRRAVLEGNFTNACNECEGDCEYRPDPDPDPMPNPDPTRPPIPPLPPIL